MYFIINTKLLWINVAIKETFDNILFGINSKQASKMDPQESYFIHRKLFLER